MEHTNEQNATVTPWARQSEYEIVLDNLKKAEKARGRKGELISSQIGLIRGVIGRGEHSVVYVGELMGSKRLITVKYDRRDFSRDFCDIIPKIKNLQRIDHPYIAKLMDVIPDEENGRTFILMDYTPGETLQHRLNHTGITQEEALDWTCQILDALNYLHEGIPIPVKDWDGPKKDAPVEKIIHIIHGNIRTDNISLRPVRIDGNIKFEVRLIDFRLGLINNPTITTGRPDGYAIFGNAWVERADDVQEKGGLTPEEFYKMASWDVYCTGAVLFYMLTGIFPTREMNGSKKETILRANNVTEAVIEILCKSLDTDNPENRYQTAEAMLAAIRSLSTNHFQRLKGWMGKALSFWGATKATQPSRKDTLRHRAESVRGFRWKGGVSADVFISYHMKTASGTVKAIADNLERHGVSCWYAPRNQTVGAYSASIIEAIDNCKVFLLILNESATRSRHVLSELAAAFERFNRNEEGIKLLPVRVDNCSLSAEMRYYLAFLQIIDISSADSVPVDKITELVSDTLKTFAAQSQTETDT